MNLPETTSPTPPPPPRGAVWIDATMAAFRLDFTPRQARQMCADKWAALGLAKLETPPEGGQARWIVREDADRRLAPVKFPGEMGADVSDLNGEQRAAWEERLALFHGWRAACAEAIRAGGLKKDATDAYIAGIGAQQGVKLSLKTLELWYRLWRAEGDEGLVDRRWRRQDKAKPADPFLAEAARLWLKSRLSKQQIFEMVCEQAARMGWRQWGIRTVERHIATISPHKRILCREGEKAFNDKAAPYLERDYSTLASNELLNADHHEFDVIIELPGRTDFATGEVKRRFCRPWLTAWQDCRSRKIVGWAIYTDDPCTDWIIVTLARAVKAYGVPESVAVDNGRDFDSYTLHGRTKKQRRKVRVQHDQQRLGGIFTQLQIKAHNVQIYHGQSKPIERFFGTLEARFGKQWETYCGNKPENKPEGLQDRLEAGKAPSLEEFTEKFALWVEGDYNARVHTGDSMDGKTPDQAFAENLAVKRTAPDAVLDLMLLKLSKPLKVGRNGVTWNGLRYGQYEPLLTRLLGQEVILRVDPADVSRVTCWTLDDLFICAAEANRRVPANATAGLLREAMAEKRRATKALRDSAGMRMHLHEDLPERMARLAAQKIQDAAAPDPLPPTSIQPLRSPFEDQLPAYRSAMEAARQPATAKVSSLDIFSAGDDDSEEARSARRQEFIERLKAEAAARGQVIPENVPSLVDICGGAA